MASKVFFMLSMFENALISWKSHSAKYKIVRIKPLPWTFLRHAEHVKTVKQRAESHSTTEVRRLLSRSMKYLRILRNVFNLIVAEMIFARSRGVFMWTAMSKERNTLN